MSMSCIRYWLVFLGFLASAGIARGQNAGEETLNRMLRDVGGSLHVSVRQNGDGSTSDDRWKMQWTVSKMAGQADAADAKLTCTLREGMEQATAVEVSFDFSKWSRDNYVLVPAVVYNGNRYRAIGNGYGPQYPQDMYYNPAVPLTISNDPRLQVEKGKAASIELQTGNASTPAMCFFAPGLKKGFIVLTSQGTRFGNNGLSIAENAGQDSCSMLITVPSMRKLATGFGDFHPSGDKAPDWKAGDAVTIPFRIYVFDAADIPALLKKFMEVRKQLTGENHPRDMLPMSQEFDWGTTICRDHWSENPVGNYFLPENSKDFQLGWVSGMINTYPILALNDPLQRSRVGEELDFITGKMQGASGYFYGGITADGRLRPEKMHPELPAVQAMVRKNGDALFWLVKHLMLLKAQGHSDLIKPDWEDAARKLAVAFVKTWKKDGQFGQYIVPETGEIAVFNSTAGAIVPAGLALASQYFHDPELLSVAGAAARYYYARDVVRQGLTSGACGDISQDPDSETAFGFLQSLMTLYDVTGDAQWLDKAKVQAALCSTWVLSYDASFPPSSGIGGLDCHMAGAVFASAQNKHAAPGICTSSGDYLFRLYRATGNPLYADLIRDIQHAHAEAVNRPDHITTGNLVGSSMERIQPSDAEGRGAVGNFINTRNSWTETDGILMDLELPGIYVQTNSGRIRVFDQVKVTRMRASGWAAASGIDLLVENRTPYDARVSVFAETAAAAGAPMESAAFLKWPRVVVQAGGETIVHIDRDGKVTAHVKPGAPFLAFPETRENPMHWTDPIHENWLQKDWTKEEFLFHGQPDEYFVYQVGVAALKSKQTNVHIEFSDLTGDGGRKIPAEKMTCFTTGGIDFKGKPFTKRVDVAAGKLQPFWIGADLSGVSVGKYEGNVVVRSGGQSRKLKIAIDVSGEPVADHGFGEGKRLSRMAWLNNRLGIDDQVTRGYSPVIRQTDTIHILGRTFVIGPDGLPAEIETFFSPSNQSIGNGGEPLLHSGFRFIVEKADGGKIVLHPGKIRFTGAAPGYVSWEVTSTAAECSLVCKGRMEYDGFVDYSLALKAARPLKIKDIRLEVPMNRDKADYMMGLGREGGLRPQGWDWRWDTTRNQDMLWLGAVNGGLRIKWKAENYQRPLVNIYYSFGPLHLPPSWGNELKGGVRVSETGSEVLVSAYSGSREMQTGEVQHYDFELLVTPFHTINKAIQFGDRYFQGGGQDAYSKIGKAERAGANIVTIHQAESLYPFINYPYLDDGVDSLKQLIGLAHKDNLRMKLYYTTREITKNMPEFFPFFSMNGELIYPGPGNASRTLALHPKGPDEWLVKNLKEKYIPAWYNPITKGKFAGAVDLSVITTPDSRLNNFYIGGLDWMLRNLHIDGVYIDDAALDRFTIRRARKLIDLYRPEGRMDMHSWNHFCEAAGFANCLNLYMDLLPYLDLVWIGEGRNYDRLPDHWLVEVSGIPFGLTGQMLEGGGNPWRGMVYGITNRAGWSGNPPTDIWKFWDAHQMKEKTMMGYWEKGSPIRSNNPSIEATIYKGNDESIISVANWAEDEQHVSFTVDWSKLGLDPGQSDLYIPEIKDFQSEQGKVLLDQMTIPAKKGYLIVITKRK